MFTFLDIIRSSMNYVNLSVVLKNRIYTIVAGIGNFYLLYVAFRFYQNKFWGRGTLFILAFLIIAYFTYLNALYYFTKTKKSKFDVSPWIEKTLHIQAKDPITTAENSKSTIGYVQTNGIFQDEDFLATSMVHTMKQHDNIQQIASELIRLGYIKADYQGLQDDEIAAKIKETGKPVPALGNPVVLPYFELTQKGNALVVLGGINQIDRREIATIKKVGLLTAKEAMARYHLYIATAVLVGGPEKINGRTGLIEKPTPYQLKIKVAYRERGENQTSLPAYSTNANSTQSAQCSNSFIESTTANDQQSLSRSQHEDFNDFGPRSQTHSKWRRNNRKH